MRDFWSRTIVSSEPGGGPVLHLPLPDIPDTHYTLHDVREKQPAHENEVSTRFTITSRNSYITIPCDSQ
jgi:hypothetical protein